MSMKIIGGLVAIILIGGGAYYFVTKGPATSGTDTQTSTTGTNSLGGLVAAGKSVTCTFATTTAANTTKGTIYVANGMVAADFVTNDPRIGDIQSHMISRDNTAYVWTSLSNQGFKSEVTGANSSTGPNSPVDYNQPVDYNCSDWTPDESKFVVPTNILFGPALPGGTSGSVQGSTGAGMSGNAAQCAQCDQVPGEGRAQCRAALQCK